MPSPIFDAPLTSSLVPVTAGNGTATFTRATTAYVSGVAPTGNAVDGEVLILCDAGEARFAGARRISANNWSPLYADGSAIPAAKLLGFVAENAATNNQPQSQTFDNATWTKDNFPVLADNIAAPDGTLTADKFTDNAVSAVHRVYSFAFSATTATVYTISVYAKSGTLPWMQLDHQTDISRWANFNLTTGVVGNKAAGVTASIQALPNGWYRCSVTSTTGAAGGVVAVYSIITDQNNASPVYVGTGQTMYLWGAQVEQSSDPTSYIPTTTVAVVRNLDNLQYPMVGNLGNAIATAYVESYLPVAASADYHFLVRGTAAVNTVLYFVPTTKVLENTSPGGVATTANQRTIGVVNKGVAAYSGATSSVCLNGAAVATGAFSAYPNSGNVVLGGFTSSGFAVQGSIRNVKFFSARLTDAQLIDLTEDGVLTPDPEPPSTAAQPGGIARVRRYRRIEVEIDGEIFPVASEEEGRELLLKAREAAKQAAQAAAVRAAAKAEKKTSPAAVERALALSTPRISLRADDRAEALAQAIQAQVDAAQAAIDEDYATARRMAYAYVRQRLQDEHRQRELAADEEEVIAMILRLP